MMAMGSCQGVSGSFWAEIRQVQGRYDQKNYMAVSVNLGPLLWVPL